MIFVVSNNDAMKRVTKFPFHRCQLLGVIPFLLLERCLITTSFISVTIFQIPTDIWTFKNSKVSSKEKVS